MLELDVRLEERPVDHRPVAASEIAEDPAVPLAGDACVVTADGLLGDADVGARSRPMTTASLEKGYAG